MRQRRLWAVATGGAVWQWREGDWIRVQPQADVQSFSQVAVGGPGGSVA